MPLLIRCSVLLEILASMLEDHRHVQDTLGWSQVINWRVLNWSKVSMSHRQWAYPRFTAFDAALNWLTSASSELARPNSCTCKRDFILGRHNQTARSWIQSYTNFLLCKIFPCIHSREYFQWQSYLSSFFSSCQLSRKTKLWRSGTIGSLKLASDVSVN